MMLKRPAKWGMCFARSCFLAGVIPVGMCALWYEQLSGHKQSTYIEAAGANWWRLTGVELAFGEEGSVLTAAEMGMASLAGDNTSQSWWGGSGGQVLGVTGNPALELQSVLDLVHLPQFVNEPTLRFLDADVKTLRDVRESMGPAGQGGARAWGREDACFYGQLTRVIPFASSSRLPSWGLPDVYKPGMRALGASG